VSQPLPGLRHAPEPAVAPPPGNPRFPLFDGLRAIAALTVVLYHSIIFTDWFAGWHGAFARQLSAGVTVFFLISGFLLYRPFVAGRLSGREPILLRDYARRRLLRIVPAYWLALTALAIWPGLPGHVFSSDWWIYYAFAQDFGQSTLFGGLGTAWSLGTEVTFYAFLPVYAVVLARPLFRRSLRRVLGCELAVLGLLSFGSLGFRAAVFDSSPHLAYTLLGTFDWFALGMALAVVSAVTAQAGVRPRAIALVERHAWLCWAASFAVISLAAWFWVHSGRAASPYSAGPLHVLWGVAAAFLILPAVFHGGGFPRRVLSARLATWLGLVSYGVYLWHLPLIPKLAAAERWAGVPATGLVAMVVLFALVAVVAVACAAGSYYAVERPILKLKERRRPDAPKAAPAAAAVPAES
jgi:peptidoglycan/LPS O-acetylase OafA/YrhL